MVGPPAKRFRPIGINSHPAIRTDTAPVGPVTHHKNGGQPRTDDTLSRLHTPQRFEAGKADHPRTQRPDRRDETREESYCIR